MNNKRTIDAISKVILLLAALALSGCNVASILPGQAQPTPIPTVAATSGVTAEGRLVPAAYSGLAFITGGEVSEILVEEGGEVAAGDGLIRLGNQEALEAALAGARFEILSAQQAIDTLHDKAGLARTQAEQTLVQDRRTLIDAQEILDDLDTDTFQEDLDDLEIAVTDAQDALDDAREELDKQKDLDPDNTRRKNSQDEYDDALQAYEDAVVDRDLLQNQLDQAEAAVSLAQSALDDAQRIRDSLQDGPDPDDLALAQARLDSANAQAAAAERALQDMLLSAPYAGVVIDLADLDPGEYVAPGKPVVTIADTSQWFVETRDLTELDVVEIEIGQQVSVIPDALPELELTGEVVAIDRGFLERSGDILYTVRVRLDGSDPRLRWGMTVTATFEE